MSRKEMDLLSLLCERVGITTIGELEAFKEKTNATTNNGLIRNLALYVAADKKFTDDENEPFHY